MRPGRDIVTRTRAPARRRSGEPDECRHAPALPVAPVGEEALRLGVGAPVTAEHGADAGGCEPRARQRAEIALPAATGVGAEGHARRRVARYERAAHLFTDFEVRRADRRPEPGEQLARRDAE